MAVDVVVPAHNEAPWIADVLTAIKGAPSAAQLIVVVDASSDDTAAIAQKFADVVVPSGAADKGSAMAAGLASVVTDHVLFIDADLNGLLPGHVEAMCTYPPDTGQLVGVRGRSPSGINYPRWFGLAPSLSGERRVPVGLARSVPLMGAGWKAETMLNVAVARARLPWRHIMLYGVSNRTKTFSDPIGLAKEGVQVTAEEIGNAPELLRYVSHPSG